MLVAFTDEPERGRFWAASPAALVALKAQAFGRTRHDGEAVDRDFSDAMLLLDRLGPEIAREIPAPSPMRGRVKQAAERLLKDDACAAAARKCPIRRKKVVEPQRVRKAGTGYGTEGREFESLLAR